MGAGRHAHPRQVHGAVQRATPRVQQVEHRDEAVRVLERCRNLEAVLWMQLGVSASLDVGTALVVHLADTWGVAGAVRTPLRALGSIVSSTRSEHTASPGSLFHCVGIGASLPGRPRVGMLRLCLKGEPVGMGRDLKIGRA